MSTSSTTPALAPRPRPAWLRFSLWALIGGGTGVALASTTGPFPTRHLQNLEARRVALSRDTLRLHDQIASWARQTAALRSDRRTQAEHLRGTLGMAESAELTYRLVPTPPSDSLHTPQ